MKTTRTRRVHLLDGRVVEVRPIRLSDTDGLLELYARLSAESRRFRFLSASSIKLHTDAERLTRPDGRYDCVLVASAYESGQERLVAVAQLAGYGSGAEAALVVRDDHHGVGLGSVLFRELLLAAGERGVPQVEATVLSGNSRILRLLRRHRARLGAPEGGVLHATIDFRRPAPERSTDRIAS